MKKILLLLICFSLIACGTIELGYVQPMPGRTADQKQSDTLYCKDQASLAANSPGMQIGAFLLGATIIGVPAAYAIEVSTKREVFSDCMQNKGYRVIPPDDGPGNTAQNRQLKTSNLDHSFSSVNDAEAVPYIGEDGKAGYQRFLSQRNNRAFAISETGGWGSSWNWKTTSDAISFALEKCLARSSIPCKIYAVNDDVVWEPKIPAGSSSFKTDAPPKSISEVAGVQKTFGSTAESVNKLIELKKLLDSGVITQQDYNTKKASILKAM